MMDEPSGVRNDQTETSVDGALALTFHGFDAVMGQTYEVWFIKGISLRSLHIQRARTWAQRNYVHPGDLYKFSAADHDRGRFMGWPRRPHRVSVEGQLLNCQELLTSSLLKLAGAWCD